MKNELKRENYSSSQNARRVVVAVVDTVVVAFKKIKNATITD